MSEAEGPGLLSVGSVPFGRLFRFCLDVDPFVELSPVVEEGNCDRDWMADIDVGVDVNFSEPRLSFSVSVLDLGGFDFVLLLDDEEEDVATGW